MYVCINIEYEIIFQILPKIFAKFSKLYNGLRKDLVSQLSCTVCTVSCTQNHAKKYGEMRKLKLPLSCISIQHFIYIIPINYVFYDCNKYSYSHLCLPKTIRPLPLQGVQKLLFDLFSMKVIYYKLSTINQCFWNLLLIVQAPSTNCY